MLLPLDGMLAHCVLHYLPEICQVTVINRMLEPIYSITTCKSHEVLLRVGGWGEECLMSSKLKHASKILSANVYDK